MTRATLRADLLERLKTARVELSAAERDLAAVIEALGKPSGDTSMITDTVAAAFERVRNARQKIDELTLALDADEE